MAARYQLDGRCDLCRAVCYNLQLCIDAARSLLLPNQLCCSMMVQSDSLVLQAKEDVASSTGRVVYKNLHTGHAQYERPTKPADEQVAAPSSKHPPQAKLTSTPKPAQTKPKATPANSEKKCVTPVTKNAESAKCSKPAGPKPAAKPAQVANPKPVASVAQNCSVSEAGAAALKLHRAAEASAERERKKKGVKHMTVAQLLEKTELTQFESKFQEADFDDACLKQVIDELNEDKEAGMELLEELLSRVGVSGGATARIKRQLQTKQPEAEPQQNNKRGDKKPKEKGKADPKSKSKDKKDEIKKEKPKDEKTKCPGCGKRSIITKKNPCKNCKAF